MRVTSRDGNGEWRGRVKTVVLEGVDTAGNATSVSTTGAGVYNANVVAGQLGRPEVELVARAAGQQLRPSSARASRPDWSRAPASAPAR